MTTQKRDAFVFYRSYYEAMKSMPPKSRLAIYEAIFAYALDDEEPEISGALATVFQLTKHSLDIGKQKAESGRKGGMASSCAKRKQIEANATKGAAIKNKKQEIKNKKQETRNEKQEIKNEKQEIKNSSTAESSIPEEVPAEEKPSVPFGEIMERYHDLCASFPQLRSIEGERRRAVSARWREHPSLKTFEELFCAAEASSFLKGYNDRGWKADFDWMMKESNFLKILEGKYNERTVPSARSVSSDESYFTDPSAYENYSL